MRAGEQLREQPRTFRPAVPERVVKIEAAYDPRAFADSGLEEQRLVSPDVVEIQLASEGRRRAVYVQCPDQDIRLRGQTVENDCLCALQQVEPAGVAPAVGCNGTSDWRIIHNGAGIAVSRKNAEPPSRFPSRYIRWKNTGRRKEHYATAAFGDFEKAQFGLPRHIGGRRRKRPFRRQWSCAKR